MGDGLSIEGFAKESDKIAKTRQKLEKRLEQQDQILSDKGKLDETIAQIQNYIARQAEVRVYVKKESLSLFDNNQNPAESSARVNNFAKRVLNADLFSKTSKDADCNLKGRNIEAQ